MRFSHECLQVELKVLKGDNEGFLLVSTKSSACTGLENSVDFEVLKSCLAR